MPESPLIPSVFPAYEGGLRHRRSRVDARVRGPRRTLQRTTARSAVAVALAVLTACSARSQQVVDVWPGVAPGSEGWTQTERTVEDTPLGAVAFNVVTPTLTAYLPDPARATGTAVVIAPGGYFVALTLDLEGEGVARWLQERGIAAFVLKYRLVEKVTEGVPQNMDMDAAGRYGIADGVQALRVVRERAAEWGLSPERVGLLGFSAGAMVTAGALTQEDAGARPSFAAMVYGGPFGVMPAIPADLPPVFLAWAQDDAVALAPVVRWSDALTSAGHRPEVHVFASGGHGFGMRRQGTSSDHWIDAFYYWLDAQGLTRRPGDSAVAAHVAPPVGGGRAAPLVIGETFTLPSSVLGETRRINVYAPYGYAESDTLRLPVLYMPDGGVQEDFLHVAGLVQILSLNGGMRPHLLVGIENTERRRDLTGPTEVAADRAIAPRVGGSAAFRAFLRDELRPAVDSLYRTTGETAIVGESLAGLFVVETLLLEPTLFDTYVAIDPSLWWNGGRLAADAAALIQRAPGAGKTLYLATSSEGEVEVAERFADVLGTGGAGGLRVHDVHLPEETHLTVYHPAALGAFRAVLAPAPSE
ncbi:MAG TPA: alpha/beta hydrolase-fold protein [Rubricoccaceae bacterium]